MLLKYANKLKCIEEDVSVYGNYDTGVFSSLMIVFEKCDPELRTCKDPKEIKEWLKLKFIFTVTNTKKFVQYKFG